MLRIRIPAASCSSILFFLILFTDAQSAFAEDADRFSASAVDSQAATGRVIDLDIRIKAYTSDEQIADYARLLENGDQSALARLLESTDVGRISSMGNVGDQIAIARIADTSNGGQVITMVTSRKIRWSLEMTFLGPAFGTKYMDYPFSLIELRLDREGRGEGLVMAAVKIHITSEGLLQTERLRAPSTPNVLQLVNVRRLK